MAYMTQEHKKQLAPKINEVFKKFGIKGTLSVRDHSVLVVNIKSGSINFGLDESGYESVNEYHIEKEFNGEAKKFLLALASAMMVGNHDNSDPQTDYFDVGWYIDINVGNRNMGRPYLLTP